MNEQQLVTNGIIKTLCLSQGFGPVTSVLAVGRGLSSHTGMKHQVFPAGVWVFGKKNLGESLENEVKAADGTGWRWR